jgi:hypothetical protein
MPTPSRSPGRTATWCRCPAARHSKDCPPAHRGAAAAIDEATAGDRLTGQRKEPADVDGDRILGGIDQDLMSSYLAGSVNSFPCRLELRRRCETPCGDANGDGQGVDVGDLVAIVNFVNRFVLPSRCQFSASDINGDRRLDQTDLDAISLAFQNGELVPLPGCAQ